MSQTMYNSYEYYIVTATHNMCRMRQHMGREVTMLRKFLRSSRHSFRNIIIVFTLICVVIGILCFQYYQKLQYTVKAESSGYLQEISKQMSTNIEKTINDNFSVLGTIETVLKNSTAVTYKQLQEVVLEQKNYWNYKKIMLIDENGVAHDDEGMTVVLTSDAYLQDVIVGKKNSMSSSQVIEGEECVIFAIPLDNMVVDGMKMQALAASYSLSTFDKILSMTAFDGMGYAHIIRKDGSVVIRSSSENAAQTGYNLLSYLSNSESLGEKTYEDVKADITSGRGGQAEFLMGETQEYMAYTPFVVQPWYLLTFVPISVVNAKSELLLNLTILLCGVITFAFAGLIVVVMLSFYRHKRRLEQIAYVDPITGGNTAQRFYDFAGSALSISGKPQYCIVFSNIEKFKVLNEQFGRNACNNILRSIQNGISPDLKDEECMGRISADNFGILAKYTDDAEIAARFDRWYVACMGYIEKNETAWLPLTIEFGVYVIENDTMALPLMVDRAKLALSVTTRELRGKLRYAIYDERIRNRLFREKQIEDMMEEALERNEFHVYLQPKYRVQTEVIGGAEALVRWVSTTEGMIYPDEFISLFEKNGFIIQLDLWVFEEVCRNMRKWLDAGLSPVKVSVNCSRIHLKNPNFLDRYSTIAAKYNLPNGIIEIELTENTVLEDVTTLAQTIDKIHNAGFGCSMDDFGSGYSSLNAIQDIPVDTLKLDKIFFRSGSKDLPRTESVVGSIISMAKALSMETVAEGVEERPQVDMLKRLDCDYIQGFFFAKPMPIDQFELLAFGTVVEEK